MQAENDAAYGTFHEKPASAVAPPRRSWLRALGAAAVLAVGASYALSSRSPSPLTETVSMHADNKAQQHAQQEVDFEKAFVAGVDRTKLKEYLHAYASKPHVVGSPQDYATAVYTKEQFEKFGLKAEIVEYYTLLSKPTRMPRVAITAPANAARELNLTEASVDGDACTTDKDALPPYLAYSSSGNLTAPIVYVNYGRLEDFQWLVDNGIELKGKIALVRYGQNFRGLKIMLAEQHGMVGTLIYSDPQDDGYGVGSAYPNGLWRPADSFQRGSAQYLSLYGGDPLTPGFASVKGAPYLTIEEATNIPHSPATVLSYAQATFILQSLSGKKAPSGWQGGLNLTNGGYFLGDDGATQVHLDLDIDNSVHTIWDVIGTIEGTEEPDQFVIIGNHRDAWVCGAVDPSSGSSTMLEIARGYGELLSQGWKPRRTIKLASWDGEESGLLGSTEYAEDNAKELLEKAVAYINVDLTFGPTISAGGTPSIAEFLFETAKSVPANKFYGNETDETLYAQWVAQSKAARAKNPAIEKLTLAPDHLISFLGSGTDFTAFYQHLGIISANIMFLFPDASTYGTYHSTMDSLMYMETEADPHYTAQATTAQWWGLLTLRLATLPVLPFDFSTYGVTMHKDLSNLEVQTKALKLEIDYSALRKAIDRFVSKSTKFTKVTEKFKAKYEAGKETDKHALELNDKLVRLERQFISEAGLPHRPWFRHVIFGPGFFEGYLGAAFPGIADGIAFKDNATTIQAHVDDVAKIVKGAADFLSTK
jgi:N-acetylated-alpha-linked acidic dipeptidase